MSVAMVLLFHGGVSWMHGGYVGVSVFFTMSGHLITSLLLAEHESSGRISLTAFYARRIKRLMPASLMCLALVAMMSWMGLYPTANHLRRETIAGALQVANWNSLTQHVSYADLVLGASGPLDHFWSLSIEEQFYWIWPLTFLGLFRLTTKRAQRLAAITTLTVGAVVVAPLIALRWGPNAAYWSTPARLAEILTGATLALILARWQRRSQWLSLLGTVGCLAIVTAAILFPTDHGPAYGGWLGVGSLASVALIAGLQVPGGLRNLFSRSAAVALGRISYGVYVFHWPIFTLITPQRTGWSGSGLLSARIAITLTVATISFHLVEQPIRRRSFAFNRAAPLAALATAAVVAVALTVTSVPTTSFGAATDLQRQVTITPTTDHLLPVVVDTNNAPTRPVRIVVLGDSTAQALSAGMVKWAAEHPASAQISVLAEPGCGLVRSVKLHDDDGRLQLACNNVLDVQLPALLAATPPDVAVVMVTLPDITPREWDSAEGELSALDSAYKQRKQSDYAQLLDQLASAGVTRTVWLTSPLPSSAWLGYLNGPIDPMLWQSQRDAVDNLANNHPSTLTVVPFDTWLTTRELEDARAWRPDGLHLSPAGGARAMIEYLAPIILHAATP